MKKVKPICEMHDDACARGYKTKSRTFCIKCLHGGEYHAILQDRFSRFLYWLFGVKGCTVGHWCKCSKYVPNDNLKFLEELDER